MTTTEKTQITVKTRIKAPLMQVWSTFNSPEHIVQWNSASPEWHTPRAENDLRVDGRISCRMEAKDGSAGFDFSGIYTVVEAPHKLEYRLEDGRMVSVSFENDGDSVAVIEKFDAEDQNSEEMQRAGWQAILDSFKNHVENLNRMIKLHYEILINAPVEKVYETMLDEQGFRTWTAAFNPTSHFVGNWEKDTKMLFIGTDPDGKKGGMVSRVKDIIPNKFVSVEHYGIVDGDKEITEGAEVQGWAGALENYRFTGENGNTRLQVDMDANAGFENYFNETWPKALAKLKEICEA